jgi:hypothetical protein
MSLFITFIARFSESGAPGRKSVGNISWCVFKNQLYIIAASIITAEINNTGTILVVEKIFIRGGLCVDFYKKYESEKK